MSNSLKKSASQSINYIAIIDLFISYIFLCTKIVTPFKEIVFANLTLNKKMKKEKVIDLFSTWFCTQPLAQDI